MFARPSSLFVVLLASTMALAAPTPVENVIQGSVWWAMPRHYDKTAVKYLAQRTCGLGLKEIK